MIRDGRDASIDRVQRELTTVGRRGTARIRRENEAISAVDRSLLAYIRSHPGCRAVEIAAHFQLNRSTVSRQLGALLDHGLVTAAGTAAPSTGRGVALHLTPEGESVLTSAAELLHRDMTERFAEWTEEEIEQFARLLERYNGNAGNSVEH
ncbi:MarR family transcriptional regulator [Leifsonia sp. fls2-241-R2A-40a]|uniref:MarR family winged helix-turn-helix transcriptional regulator n=1 Tax=Leifsonia sp. fls2-241-R2A-40a TaxID=3040290 RepID=UPI00254A5810|nr:MarR family transcriptional regulator [Leifsonia sp. fls2-241-R2A-40a]